MHPTIRILAIITVALSVILFTLYMLGPTPVKHGFFDYTDLPSMDLCASAFAECNKNCNDQTISSQCLTACNGAADSCKAIVYQNMFSRVDTIGAVLWTSPSKNVCSTLTIYGELNPGIKLDSLTGEALLTGNPPARSLSNPYFNIYAEVGSKSYNNNFWSLSLDNTIGIGGANYDIKILLSKGSQTQIVNISFDIPRCTKNEFAHVWGYQIKKENYKKL